MKYIYNNLKHGIHNLFRYFTVIWKDRGWDHSYIYILLRKKLYIMSNSIERCNRYGGVERDVKKMRFCIKCLDRLIEDDYFDPKDELEKKYGEFLFKQEKNDTGEYYIVSRVNLKTEQEQKAYEKEFLKFLRIGEHNKGRDIRLLFDIMKNNIEKWWD